jgi:hypothetical protein
VKKEKSNDLPLADIKGLIKELKENPEGRLEIAAIINYNQNLALQQVSTKLQ